MAAAAGASGARTWLQVHGFTWLTPQRMKAATVSLFALALVVSSIGISGSSTSASAHGPARAALTPSSGHR